MKYYIIAGEASGDLHGAGLIKALKEQDPNAEIRFWGGDLMAAAGGTLVKHYRDLAFMGFIEVILNLGTILKNLAFCKKDIASFAPDAIVFIDYPGFNMRIAKWAKSHKMSTHYYISPQIWAWKENRIKDIKRDIDHMYVILPFEKEFYENKHNYKVSFVGHPLLDAIAPRETVTAEAFKEKYKLDDLPIIALLPGSRKQEINSMLGIMISVVKHFPDYQFVIAGAPAQDVSMYEAFLEKKVHYVNNDTYNLLSVAAAALVTSGTATLETALYRVPEVVCYKGSWISYQIAKRIITLKYISLVNLIMDRPVVTELIQSELNEKRLREELAKILRAENRDILLKEYELLVQKLGNSGAAVRTAHLIYNALQNKS